MKEKKIIDLSYILQDNMLVYPGNERPVYQWLGRTNSEGYNLTRLTMNVHTGTHVDAPKHFLDNVKSIDEVPLEKLFAKACIFKYNKKLNGQEITLKEIISTGFELKAGHIFIMETGIGKYAESSKYNQIFPVPSKEVIDWLIKNRIKSYMTDATAVDPFGSKDSPNHHLLLGSDIPIVENLKDLHLIPTGKEFWISALPLKLKGREGAPCRAIAIMDF